MNKIVRDGKVAVLYSPRHGAGWSTWNTSALAKTLTMDARIVQCVLDKDTTKAAEVAEQIGRDMGENHVCVLGARDLVVAWLPEGTRFLIKEYDGFERVEVLDQIDFLTA